MRKLFTILLVFLALSCNKNSERMLHNMNGYWEIDQVIRSDGSKIDYTFNETVDFFSIKENFTGFRKKVRPNLDGSFSTSEDVELLKVVIKNDSVYLYYTTPYAQWKETVLKATENQLIIQNQDKLKYNYKRYKPLDLN